MFLLKMRENFIVDPNVVVHKFVAVSTGQPVCLSSFFYGRLDGLLVVQR